MADPREVQAWLDGLQRQRQEKLSETSGIGDILALEQPMATLLGSVMEGLDKKTRLSDMPLSGSVVSPAIKKSRAAALKAYLDTARPKPRVDVIPENLYKPSSQREELLRKINETAYQGIKDSFYHSGDRYTKNFEVLKNNSPHSGLSITSGTKYGPYENIAVDVAPRANEKLLAEYLQKKERAAEAKVRFDAARSRGEYNFDDYPEFVGFPFHALKTPFDPVSVRQLSKFAASRYPEHSGVGGYRISGIRVGKAKRPDTNSGRQTEIQLPRLSDTQRLSAQQQVEKWLHEMINSRATPKTRTAGR